MRYSGKPIDWLIFLSGQNDLTSHDVARCHEQIDTHAHTRTQRDRQTDITDAHNAKHRNTQNHDTQTERRVYLPADIWVKSRWGYFAGKLHCYTKSPNTTSYFLELSVFCVLVYILYTLCLKKHPRHFRL